MPRLTIYKDNYADSTAVSNRFIDEYMKDANDAQIKVYLYLIRMLDDAHTISVSDIADKFNHTEKDVIRSLKYWERRGLLTIDWDEDHAVTGIHLKDPGSVSGSDPDAVSADRGTLISFPSPSKTMSDVSENTVTAAGEESDFIKRSYTPDEISAFKEREDIKQLIFIAQTYMGRPLTTAEVQSLLFIMDVLHFSVDLTDYLIQYCVDKGKKDFKYIEKVAINWKEKGITTPLEASRQVPRFDGNVYTVMKHLGKTDTPTDREAEFITRWTKDFGFDNDVIFEACERTVMATDKHRFEYADSILDSWYKAGVHTKADIAKADEAYQAKRRSRAKEKSGSGNKFNQFTQNDYDFDDLEKKLISN